MATLIARDSITAADIPLNGLSAALGYGDGPHVWSSADWKRFDDAGIPVLVIVIDPAHSGDILDVETFDARPDQVPGWVRRFNRAGRRKPTVYCNRSTWPQVKAALIAAGLSISAVDWMAATLDGSLTGTDEAVAVQWKGAALTGGHYDETIVKDPSWLGHPAPASQIGGVMSGGNIQAAPFDLGRLDIVEVRSDGHVMRSWDPGGAGQIDNLKDGDWIDVYPDSLPPGGMDEVSWCWSWNKADSTWRMNMWAKSAGLVYLAVVDWSGRGVQGWTHVNGITGRRPAQPGNATLVPHTHSVATATGPASAT